MRDGLRAGSVDHSGHEHAVGDRHAGAAPADLRRRSPRLSNTATKQFRRIISVTFPRATNRPARRACAERLRDSGHRQPREHRHDREPLADRRRGRAASGAVTRRPAASGSPMNEMVRTASPVRRGRIGRARAEALTTRTSIAGARMAVPRQRRRRSPGNTRVRRARAARGARTSRARTLSRFLDMIDDKTRTSAGRRRRPENRDAVPACKARRPRPTLRGPEEDGGGLSAAPGPPAPEAAALERRTERGLLRIPGRRPRPRRRRGSASGAAAGPSGCSASPLKTRPEAKRGGGGSGSSSAP